MSKRAKGLVRGGGGLSGLRARTDSLRRAAVRAVTALGLLGLIGAATMGALGGGSSVAAATEVPRSCVEYQDALLGCFGPAAKKMKPPWQVNSKLDTRAMSIRCSQAAAQLHRACR